MTTAADARLLGVFLEDAARVQTGLVTMLGRLQELVVSQDPGELENCLVESSATLENMESLEKNREKIFGHLERITGLRIARDGLGELIAQMPDDDRDHLRDLHGKLKEAAGEVRRASMRCGMLARQALTFNEALVRALFSVGEAATVYSADGSTRRGAEMILDRSM